jgi:hypothetical protein
MLVFLSRGLGVGGTLEGLALRGPAVRNWCMGFWRPLARQGQFAPGRWGMGGRHGRYRCMGFFLR